MPGSHTVSSLSTRSCNDAPDFTPMHCFGRDLKLSSFFLVTHAASAYNLRPRRAQAVANGDSTNGGKSGKEDKDGKQSRAKAGKVAKDKDTGPPPHSKIVNDEGI